VADLGFGWNFSLARLEISADFGGLLVNLSYILNSHGAATGFSLRYSSYLSTKIICIPYLS
jgi:hypothetical protein